MMADEIYQFKITVDGTQPEIWRQIQVAQDASFYNLHLAIQSAIGWDNRSRHLFEIVDPKTAHEVQIGERIHRFMNTSANFLPEKATKLADYFTSLHSKAKYDYDFGDWLHTVELEKVLPKDPNTHYPICVAGKRACPPDYCGSVDDYQDLIEILANKNHPMYEEKKMVHEVFYGDRSNYNPDLFNPTSVSVLSDV